MRNPIAQYEPIIRDEARKFCRTNRHVEVEDAEQECRLELVLRARALADAEARGDAGALARDMASTRLAAAFLRRVREMGQDGKVTDRYVTPPDRDGSHCSLEAVAETLESAMDSDEGEPVNVEAGDIAQLTSPSHEDECVDRATLAELRGALGPMLDESAEPATIRQRRARMLPDLQELLDPARRGAA
jgi:hypothetical protein